MNQKLYIAGLLALLLALILVLPTAAQSYGPGPGDGSGANCPNGEFIDEDGDGFCDNAGTGAWGNRNPRGRMLGRQGRAAHGPFVDEDGDGVCDNFVDEDGDDVCDNCPADGTGMGRRGGQDRMSYGPGRGAPGSQ